MLMEEIIFSVSDHGPTAIENLQALLEYQPFTTSIQERAWLSICPIVGLGRETPDRRFS